MQITHEYCAANQALLNIDMYNVYNPRVKKEATLSFNRDSEPAEVHKKMRCVSGGHEQGIHFAKVDLSNSQLYQF